MHRIVSDCSEWYGLRVTNTIGLICNLACVLSKEELIPVRQDTPHSGSHGSHLFRLAIRTPSSYSKHFITRPGA